MMRTDFQLWDGDRQNDNVADIRLAVFSSAGQMGSLFDV
jgi:hypothetical protein